MVATPANAHGTQRFVTLDAFRRAGFEVTGMLNEPSAAGFEYTHRYRNTITSRREHIVVYDLGGGTFDASLVHMTGKSHDAVATAGSNQLGGDDFDALLANLVCETAGSSRRGLPRRALALLADQCREAKERLNPNSRRIVIDLESCLGEPAPAPEVTVSVADYYDICVPLVQRSIEAMAPVMARLECANDDPWPSSPASTWWAAPARCPSSAASLRELFGRRVHRSPYPSAAIAIGLAIAGDEDAGFRSPTGSRATSASSARDRAAREVTFDSIFSRDARIPSAGEAPLVHRRVYRAAHNVGRYRFVECAALDPHGVPLGDITAYGDVFFPFDREVRGARDLAAVPVRRMYHEGPLIQEEYAITHLGIVRVTIKDLETGYERAYDVGA